MDRDRDRGYVVIVKASARRTNPVACEWAGRRGATRRFDSKAAAREWAAAASDDGVPVRVQDAAPNDPAPVDGYLVADPAHRRTDRPEPPPSATLDAF